MRGTQNNQIGGVNVSGAIGSVGGDIVGRDKTTIIHIWLNKTIDHVLDQLPNVTSSDSVKGIVAEAVRSTEIIHDRSTKTALLQQEISEALRPIQTGKIVSQRLAARPDIPEQTKAELSEAFASEVKCFLTKLEENEREKSRQIALAQIAARQKAINNMTTKLQEKLSSGDYKEAHQIANELLKLDPRNRVALEVERFTIRRVEDLTGIFSRTFVIWYVLYAFAAWVAPSIMERLPTFDRFFAPLMAALLINLILQPFWVKLPRQARSLLNRLASIAFLLFLAAILANLAGYPI
jgi:hypothetical protein